LPTFQVLQPAFELRKVFKHQQIFFRGNFLAAAQGCGRLAEAELFMLRREGPTLALLIERSLLRYM
jgi:hypothetical protein